MSDKKDAERSSSDLKKALNVKVATDKNGNPKLIKKPLKRGLLKTRIKGIWKTIVGE